jgi:anaphase-promoting complex subunit 3
MGTIYYRQEKFEDAEYHFQKALSINLHSSVLYCYLGMAQVSPSDTLRVC